MRKTATAIPLFGLVPVYALWHVRDNEMIREILDWFGSSGVSMVVGVYITVLVGIVAYLWKKKPRKVPIANAPTLKIGAGVTSIQAFGDWEQIDGTGAKGDRRIFADAILVPSQAMTINALYLTLYGIKYRAKIQPQVPPFRFETWPVTDITEVRPYKVAFDIPEARALNTSDARICALSANVEYFSEPFTINFGV